MDVGPQSSLQREYENQSTSASTPASPPMPSSQLNLPTGSSGVSPEPASEGAGSGLSEPQHHLRGNYLVPTIFPFS